MKNFKKRLHNALFFIDCGIKEGIYEPDQFVDKKGNFILSDEELIKFAEYEGDRGDYYVENKENEKGVKNE